VSEKPQYQTPLELPLIAVPKSGGGEPNLALVTEIDLDRLEEILVDHFEIVVLIFDEGNSIVEIRRREFESKSLDRPVYYPYALASLPPGGHKCRVVFRNLDSGKGAVGTAEVVIKEDFPSGPAVFPPLFFIPDNPTFYLGLAGKDVRSADDEIIPLQEFCPRIGVRMTPVLDVLDQGLTNLTALIRFLSTEQAAHTSVFTVSLLDEASGEMMSVPLSVIEVLKDEEAAWPEKEGSRETVGAYTLVAEVKLPRAAPGSYLLTVGLEHPERGDKAEAVRRITIR
jgi:hypothetical protein